ncbi:unnamed protein product [Adineta steineri]|uniref:Fatty acid desaturase domain-containing protein n=1 Tax=Adineta steineri TaxID=433720 RepID=A0A814UX07_9BILA|nr:unnamed protein product [Adineta steineri]CAF4023480.1 unnamed protein product [Adineta steineri]
MATIDTVKTEKRERVSRGITRPNDDVINEAYVPYQKPTRKQKIRLLSHSLFINTITITYMVGGYILALYCLMYIDSFLMSLIATLLLTHVMVVALAISHECIHSCMSYSLWFNHAVGELSLVMSGALYVPFSELQRQHKEHHSTQAAIDSYLVSHILSTWPQWLCVVILPLEACYIPVLSFVSWWRTLIVPLYVEKYRYLRARIIIMFILRHIFFYVMWCIRPTSVVCYFIAHVLFIDIMRVYDAYHHTIPFVSRGTMLPKRDIYYEQQTTYSTVFGWHTTIRRVLDLVFLNYGYHNAHHFYPRVPWYRLHELDETMYPKSNGHIIRLPGVLKEYHRRRLDRITLKKGDLHGRPKLNEEKDADGLLMKDFIGFVMNISSLVLDVDD